MKIISTYPAKIKESSGAFEATADLYRQAVDYFIGIMLKPWDGSFSTIANSTQDFTKSRTTRLSRCQERLVPFLAIHAQESEPP